MFTAWDILEFVKDSNRKAFDVYESNAKIIDDLKTELKGANREGNLQMPRVCKQM